MKEVLTLLWIILISSVAIHYSQFEGIERSRQVLSYIAFFVKITFPSSILVSALIFLIPPLFVNDLFQFAEAHWRLIEHYSFALVFGIAGYIQWFIVVPFLIRKVKNWFSRTFKKKQSEKIEDPKQ